MNKRSCNETLAVVDLGWRTQLLVPVGELSAVIDVLTRYPQVESSYKEGHGSYWFFRVERLLPQVTLLDSPVLAEKLPEKQEEPEQQAA